MRTGRKDAQLRLGDSDFGKICSSKIIKLVSALSTGVSIGNMIDVSALTPWTNPFSLPSFVSKIDPTFRHAICQFDRINIRHNLGMSD